MRRVPRCLLAITALFALATATAAKETPSQEQLTTEQIERAIGQLADTDYWVRKHAQTLLWKAGRRAEPALVKALGAGDLEVVMAARSLLERFQWGIYPDSPPEIVALITQYRIGNDAQQSEALFKLFELGEPGRDALDAIFASEASNARSQASFTAFENKISNLAREALVTGQVDAAADLLHLAAQTGKDEAIRNLATFLSQQGELSAAIQDAQANIRSARKRGRRLAWLFRAEGNLDAAVQAAELTGDTDLMASLWFEAGHWQKLAEQYEKLLLPFGAGRGAALAEHVGYRAAFLRLAGKQKEADKVLDQLQAVNNAGDDSGAWQQAQSLMANDRAGAAIEILRATSSENNSNHGRLFDLLSKQLQYRQALEVQVDGEDKSGSHKYLLDVRQARLRYLLGEREQGLADLEALAEQELKKSTAPSVVSLIEAEMEIGLDDAAFQHTLRALEKEHHAQHPGPLLAKLFGSRGSEAEVWWIFFGEKIPAWSPHQRLRTIQRLMRAPQREGAFAEWFAQAAEHAHGVLGKDRKKWFDALTATAEHADRPDLAESFLQAVLVRSRSATVSIMLADLLAKQQRWAEAAELYDQAWKADASNCLPRYLQGYMEVRDGREEAGRQKMNQAALLPLADDRQRHELATGLTERGHHEMAIAQHELLTRTAKFRGWELGYALRRLANVALAEKEYGLAADLFERSMLDVMEVSTVFTQASAYLTVPFVVHYNRCKAALDEDDPASAAREANLALEIIPGDIDVPLLVVPGLDELGHTQEASQIFERAFSRQQELCREFPRSASRHNQLAWLAVQCNRQMDLALSHSRQAVQLAPDSAAYRDTLAEVLFIRGEKQAAIDEMIRCLELEPSSGYFAEQLARFTAPAK